MFSKIIISSKGYNVPKIKSANKLKGTAIYMGLVIAPAEG